MLSVFGIVAILMVVGMYFTPEDEIKGFWYVNPITRFPDFIVGMLLFQLYERLKNKNITALQGSIIEISSIILFLIFYLYTADIPKVYRYSCYYWLPVAVILISYSFYLIHLFVLLTYSEWQKENNLHTEWYISVPILFSIIILLSLLSYYYFEKPMNKRVKTLLNR